MTTYQTGPLIVWPDIEVLVRAWLVANVASAPNIRTETNATFATPSPDSSMTLPLVLIQRIPGGQTDANASTETADVDVECFGATRAAMWALYSEVHAWMMRLTAQHTTAGTVDQVLVSNGVGEVNYANPNVRRCVTTYSIATRPLHTLP